MENSIYKEAAQLQLTFTCPGVGGTFSVSDLFQLPMQSANNRQGNLYGIAIALNNKVKSKDDTPDFLTDVRSSPELRQDRLALAILKDVIETKKAEKAAESAQAEKAATKEKILELLAKKQDEGLAAKSPEELKELLKQL